MLSLKYIFCLLLLFTYYVIKCGSLTNLWTRKLPKLLKLEENVIVLVKWAPAQWMVTVLWNLSFTRQKSVMKTKTQKHTLASPVGPLRTDFITIGAVLTTKTLNIQPLFPHTSGNWKTMEQISTLNGRFWLKQGPLTQTQENVHYV